MPVAWRALGTLHLAVCSGEWQMLNLNYTRQCYYVLCSQTQMHDHAWVSNESFYSSTCTVDGSGYKMQPNMQPALNDLWILDSIGLTVWQCYYTFCNPATHGHSPACFTSWISWLLHVPQLTLEYRIGGKGSRQWRAGTAARGARLTPAHVNHTSTVCMCFTWRYTIHTHTHIRAPTNTSIVGVNVL